MAKALSEAIESSSYEDRKVMKETLDELEIGYSPEKVDDIEQVNEQDEGENNTSDLVKDLQTALKDKRDLEVKLTELQEKLSVSYTKEASLKDSLSKHKVAISGLTKKCESIDTLNHKIKSLEVELKTKDETIKNQRNTIEKLNESKRDSYQKSKLLNENVRSKDLDIENLKKQITSLNENLNSVKNDSAKQVNSLKDIVESMKADSSIKHKEYSSKLSKANQLVEKYKKIAEESLNKYVESQSLRLGVRVSDIKNKLPNNYTFNDIDMICEDLQNYKVNIGKLPFEISKTNNVKMRVTESKEPLKPARSSLADEVDEQLMNLAGLN